MVIYGEGVRGLGGFVVCGWGGECRKWGFFVEENRGGFIFVLRWEDEGFLIVFMILMI